MKTASDLLKASLAQCAATLATLWKVTRTDGVVMGFTDHDRDLTYDGITYKAATGFLPYFALDKGPKTLAFPWADFSKSAQGSLTRCAVSL